MDYRYMASIIIPTYNRAQLLKLTLNSILKQSVSKDIFEVIIVDDGSTDDTKDICKQFYDQINIKYFYQGKNGFRVATARNTGITNSEGNICIFVDSGVLLASNAVEEHLRSHDSEDNYAVLGYMFGFDENNTNNKMLSEMSIDPFNVDMYIDRLESNGIFDIRESLYLKLGNDLTEWPAPWAVFWTGYLSVKRDVLIKVGMFDESFNSWGMEDIDLGIALHTNNVKIILNRNLKSIHYPHEKFRTGSNQEELKSLLLKKKEYLHNKYKLDSTRLYITNDWSELNSSILDIADIR
jgi:glycosyltransferase involved in cell wall biosynthesis